ncbi:hypothetical protein JTB14_019772 [Gonioctena quinquepunctata]|nr:hypothetical protein JTB14_019772 [Gonioctena quinquepunctata]
MALGTGYTFYCSILSTRGGGSCLRCPPLNTPLVGPMIEKQDPHHRQAICPQERLLITIRYLATGDSFKDVSFKFHRGDNTIGKIVEETTAAIWNSYFVYANSYSENLETKFSTIGKVTTSDSFKDLSFKFYLGDNTIGKIAEETTAAIWNSCFVYANSYSGNLETGFSTLRRIVEFTKCFFSMVLMVVADADSSFTTIDVSDSRRNSDGAVFNFKASYIGRLLGTQKLQIPESSPLPGNEDGEPSLFYMCAEEAFPLSTYLMRPYPQEN